MRTVMKTCLWSALGIAVLLAGCSHAPMFGKAATADNLRRRVSQARVVLVGRMISLEERASISEEQEFVDGQLRTRLVWYDVAAIEVIEILKGACDSSRVFLRFLSFDQTQFPPQDRVDCRSFSSYDIWLPGIWLIDIKKDCDPRFTVERGDYLPMSKLEDVKAALSGFGNASAKKERSAE